LSVESLTTAQDRPRLVGGLALAAVGSIAFAGKAIIVKLAYRYGVDAVTVIMYRMSFALPLFLAVLWWAGRGKAPLTRNDWRTLAMLGFTGYYLASFLDFAGLQYISASLERLIVYLSPTFVLAISVLLFHQKVVPLQWVALATSYLGVLLVFGQDVSLNGSHVVLGSLLVLASAISYSLYLIFSGQIVKRLGALRITGAASSIACVLCIAQFFVLRSPSQLAVAPEVIWLSLINATVCTVLPVVLVMMAVERIGAPIAAQAGVIGPLTTILLGVLLLDEPFTVWIAAGTGLVLAGIALLTRSK